MGRFEKLGGNYAVRCLGLARRALVGLFARIKAQSTFSFRSSQRTPVSFSIGGQYSAGTPLISHCWTTWYRTDKASEKALRVGNCEIALESA